MKGYYKVYDKGDLVAELPNILTNSGRIAIGRYLAGERASWGDALAIGSGDSTPDLTNKSLDMEFWREEVDFKSYNGPASSPANKLILRSIIPSRVAGFIHEIGVYCTLTPDQILQYGPIIAAFDSSQENWSGGSDDLLSYRIGTKSLRVESGLSATLEYYGDLRAFGQDTKFKLAYFSFGSATSVKIRIASNSSNYREYAFEPDLGAGYRVESWALADFDQVGNPDWKEFFTLEVEVEGPGDIVFDGFSATDERPEDITTVLVSRALVNTNGDNFIEKLPTRELQIEYLIDLGV